MTVDLSVFSLGAIAGSGWLFAAFCCLALRRLRQRYDRSAKLCHDYAIALTAERAMRVEAVAQAVAAGADPLVACANKCAAAILKHKGGK